MTALERVIRPFTGARITPPTRLTTSSNSTSSENAVLSIGVDGGSLKTFDGQFSETISFYCDAKSKFKPKTSIVKRVRNEEDEDQYVDVETPIEFVGDKNPDYKRTKYKMDDKFNQDAEILETKTFSVD